MRKKTDIEFKAELKEKHPDIESLTPYVHYKEKIKFKHLLCGYEFWDTPDTILHKKNGCSLCVGYARMTENRLIEIVEIVHEHRIKYLYGLKGVLKKCSWECRICGHIWEAIPHNIVRGHGCPKCSIKHVAACLLTPLSEIKRKVKKVNPNIEYVEGYINTQIRCKWKCKIDGFTFYASPNQILTAHAGCPKCRKISMELPIIEFLNKMKIKYKHNAGLKGSNYNGSAVPLRIDFIIETSKGKLAIEADGSQHFYPLYGEDALLLQQERDRHKDNYLKEHGYILIRITSSPTKEWGFENHIILNKFFELLKESTDENGNVDIDLFEPYDFNRGCTKHG